MAKYNYDRYSINYEWREPPVGETGTVDTRLGGLHKTAKWNSTEGKYVLSDPYDPYNYIPAGSVAYHYRPEADGYLDKYTSRTGQYGDANVSCDREIRYNKDKSQRQIRGSYKNTVQAEDGTYPINGPHIDGNWYVRTSLANTAPTMPGAFTQPTGTLKGGSNISVAWGASTDADGNSITYFPEYRYYKNGVAQAWVALPNNSSHSRSLTLASDKTTDKIDFRVRAYDGMEYSDYRISTVFNIIHNTNPTLALVTENNVTLYENNIYRIEGSAQDGDAGQIVNVRYQINAGTARAIATAISDGATAIPFNRQLTFKGGILYDGETAITSALAEGVAHTLKVWAEDDQGGKSTVAERTFHVVPNRPPTLTIDPFTQQDGMINADSITLSGTASDPDGNDIVVKYRINDGANVQIYAGPSGAWTFDIPLSKLADGENAIVVEVTDVYDFKYSRTVKLNKHANMASLTTSTTRYKIAPPSGSAKGVLLWIQRDQTLELTADISMTNGTAQEVYTPMTLSNTAPVAGSTVEDEFTYQAAEPADNINVKLTLTGDGSITLISGVLS
ncbi:Ig-like domain-containing protein [Sporosarcina koreensis]|uniref:Ig-like domain-containing protein n=1 Tax=Sporosarcina koreensis TaxID=334735 RepID=UPI00075806E5|nr:Ig-like domain-containing protein [Sporosarcina koreensis]